MLLLALCYERRKNKGKTVIKNGQMIMVENIYGELAFIKATQVRPLTPEEEELANIYQASDNFASVVLGLAQEAADLKAWDELEFSSLEYIAHSQAVHICYVEIVFNRIRAVLSPADLLHFAGFDPKGMKRADIDLACIQTAIINNTQS